VTEPVSLDRIAEPVRKKLQLLVDAEGLNGAAKTVRCAPATLARALAGLDLTAGTRALIEQWSERERV